MIMIPCLDIQNGKSKYSYEGTFEPVEIIRSLKHKGFHHFMVIDLDGVFSGEFVHYDLVHSLKNEGVSIYVGGGIRTRQIAQKVMALGTDHLVIGTMAIKDQDLLMNLIDEFGDKLCVAIDTYEDSVFIEGWVEESDVDLNEFVGSISMLGVKHILHTEINHTDNLNICSNELMLKLSVEHNIRITPTIDISKSVDLEEFIRCGCKEVVLGGSLDVIDLNTYKNLNI